MVAKQSISECSFSEIFHFAEKRYGIEAIEYGKWENIRYVPDVTQYSKVQLDQLL